MAALNALARAQLRAAGELGAEHQVTTERGERAFAVGERVMFLQNERGLGVKNGSLGTVEGIEAGGRLTVRLDGAGADGTARRVSFELRDYGHVDHGYAATVHKAQGVTVDRCHVLASGLMDRHASYVALTRHREGVVLHYGREEFSDGAQLARVLGRERLKDTSLDYGARVGGAGLDGAGPGSRERWAADEPERGARAYAERRGLDPLRPASEIVVRPEREASGAGEAAVEPGWPVLRPGRFAGLRLGAGAGASRPVAAMEPELAPSQEAPAPPLPAEAERLGRALAGYAVAWADAARMERAGLPVLAHQEAALARAGAALEAEWANGRWYAERALRQAPELAEGVGEASGLAALAHAMRQEVEAQQALWERGRAAVQAWDGLERAYEQAEAGYDWTAKREAGERMGAFARELKRDTQLDRLLREHGRELGIEEGSRLAQVVQAREEDLARTLRRELTLRQGPSLGMRM